jgi:hypothetical protein
MRERLNLRAIRAFASILLLAMVAGCEFVGETTNPVSGGPGVCDGVPQCAADAGNPDPLHTCNVSLDAYDCNILALTAAAAEPDAMIFKAQVALESNFQVFAISGDSPCGIKAGWTDMESKSFGLMQLTPACGWLNGALLPDGHPNMTQDVSSPEWATSVFNPDVNIAEGVRAIVVGRAGVMRRYPGCTEAEYTKMALGGFNQGSRAVTGCNLMSPGATTYVRNVLSRYFDLARNAAWPNPYP